MGRLRLYLITALAFLLEDASITETISPYYMGRIVDFPQFIAAYPFKGPDRGAECGFFGGILCYLAGATPWQMALLALLGGLSGVIFHKASSFWGKWLTCLAALAGLEVLLVLGHCLAGASVFAGLRIAGPELLLSAACS
mgnify:CR=1 FL=1